MHLKYNISNVNARIGRFVRSNRQKMNMSAEELGKVRISRSFLPKLTR